VLQRCSPALADAFLTAAVLAAVAEGTSQLTGIANQAWLNLSSI
jgi:5-enolpyruvylshikimate-3-phosphate synthase